MLYSYVKTGKLERSEGSSITEGIGQGRVTDNLKGAPIDDALLIKDWDAVNMVYMYSFLIEFMTLHIPFVSF